MFRKTLDTIKKSLSWTSVPGYSSLFSATPPIKTDLEYVSIESAAPHSSVLTACIEFISAALNSSTLTVQQEVDGDWTPMPDSPLSELLARPNPYDTVDDIIAGTVYDLVILGNAYWRIDRSGYVAPARELRRLPALNVSPQVARDGQSITSYRVRRRDIMTLLPDDVVHFRWGQDPLWPVLGRSPVQSLIGELSTDIESMRASYALLRNKGTGSMVFPSNVLSEKDARAFGENMKDMLGGDRRGSFLVSAQPIDLKEVPFNTANLDLSAVRNIPEERVTAVLGIPASVVGFGSGLEQTKVGATMREQKRLAWDRCIIPIQMRIASALHGALLDEFHDAGYRVAFDNSDVHELQKDASQESARAVNEYRTGLLTQNEARARLGYEPTPEGDEFYSSPAATLGLPAETDKSAPFQKNRADEFLLILDSYRELDANFMIGKLKDIFDDVGGWAAGFAQFGIDDVEGQLAQAIGRGDLAQFEQRLSRTYRDLYGKSLRNVTGAFNTMFRGSVNLPDTASKKVLEVGGTRLGLIDLEKSTKESLFRSLSQARDAGENPAQMVERIGRQVGRGVFNSSETRAWVIARTETAHAQNTSAVEVYRASERVTHVRIRDAQLGDTDFICQAINGRIVPMSDIDSVPATAHPNCSRAFAPLVK